MFINYNGFLEKFNNQFNTHTHTHTQKTKTLSKKYKLIIDQE